MTQTDIQGRIEGRLECLFRKAIVLLFLFLVPQFAFGQGEQFHGTIVTEEGQTRVVKQFTNLHDGMYVEYRGSRTEFPMTNIKSVLRPEDGDDTLIITNRKGKKIKVKSEMESMCDGSIFDYSSINPATGEYSENYIDAENVKKVVFGEDYGSLRRCPDGGKTFPPDYVFCPYHKTELELIQVGE